MNVRLSVPVGSTRPTLWIGAGRAESRYHLPQEIHNVMSQLKAVINCLSDSGHVHTHLDAFKILHVKQDFIPAIIWIIL